MIKELKLGPTQMEVLTMSENTAVVTAPATPEAAPAPVKEKRKRTDYGITDEQFVDAWQNANTAQAAADAMSKVAGRTVPKAIVLARAAVYRSKGVNLKKMERRNPRKLDVGKLNASIAKVNEAAAAPATPQA